MNLYYSMPRKEFYDKFSTIVTATDSVYITGWRHFFGTGISYYRNILGHDNEPILLHYVEYGLTRDEAAALFARDRAFFYGAFHVDRKSSAAGCGAGPAPRRGGR